MNAHPVELDRCAGASATTKIPVPLVGTAEGGSRVSSLPRGAKAAARGTAPSLETLVGMFFFFSNRMGLAGSIVVSLLLSIVLLYACSRV
jgi:hypothetical protein